MFKVERTIQGPGEDIDLECGSSLKCHNQVHGRKCVPKFGYLFALVRHLLMCQSFNYFFLCQWGYRFYVSLN